MIAGEPTLRVLACGAIDRADDGAAVRAVRRVPAERRRRWQIDEVGQLSAEQLFGDPPGLRRVVVDCVAGLPVGEVTELPLAELPGLEAAAQRTSSHALGPGQAVALARVVGAVQPQDRFIGIGGACFTAGGELSPAVHDALDRVVQRLLALDRGEPCA
jgi:hydrogenase maturation protease